MPIAREARKAAMLYIAGQDPADAGWEPPTGDYTVGLFTEGDVEITGGGYAPGTVAVEGCFGLVGGGASWSVRNIVTVRVPAAGEASGEWQAFQIVKFFRTGETEPDFVFPLNATVVVTEGLHMEFSPGELILDDGSE